MSEAALYLVMRVDGEAVGLPVLQVREILEPEAVTRVPGAAPALQGVINLRGSVVPMVDLAAALALRAPNVSKARCVALLETGMDGDRILIGLAADSVEEVVAIMPADIGPAPSFGSRVAPRHLVGLARTGGTFVLLLDVARIVETVLGTTPAPGAEATGTTAAVAPQL